MPGRPGCGQPPAWPDRSGSDGWVSAESPPHFSLGRCRPRGDTSCWSRMGRESRLLLALLGLLAGVFVAALTIRLFSPRPPKGAGPDIHAAPASSAPTPLVPPPVLTPRPRPEASRPRPADRAPKDDVERFAAGELPTLKPPIAADRVEPRAANTTARFSASKNRTRLVSNDEPVTAAAPPWQAADQPRLQPAAAGTSVSLQPPVPPPPAPQTATAAAPRAFESPPVPAPSTPPPGPPPVTPGEPYVVVADDCWWSIAERAYGDGRYYRSLFAWNRVIDPEISLAAGTTLEIPPPARLQLAWPRLVPTD